MDCPKDSCNGVVPATRLVDGRFLAEFKSRVQQDDAHVQAGYRSLKKRADEALHQRPVSVTDKKITPPSGDMHDYMSLGPFWWPNPETRDGLPYVRRDGHENPEYEQLDAFRLRTLNDSVGVLALSYYLTDKEVYARHAARMIRAWFLNRATRMNPNLRFGQHIPGVAEGRGYGLIETRRLVDIGEATALLADSSAWRSRDRQGLNQWYRDFLAWMLESSLGRDEAAAVNNHGTWYDVQVIYFALFTGRRSIARRVLDEFARKRMAGNILPDGRQPLELGRTKSFGYSVFNLEALFAAASLAKQLGIDLWHWTYREHGSLKRALEFLLPYARGDKAWPYTQIVDIAEYRERMETLLSIAAVHYPGLRYDPGPGQHTVPGVFPGSVWLRGST